MQKLALIKIGGGLITDKEKPLTTRNDMISIAAESIRLAIEYFPDMLFVVGNGAGSFGHYVAASRDAGMGDEEHMRAVHESVAALNALFVEALMRKGVRAKSVSPASHFHCTDGVISHADLGPIENALKEASVPVIFGDIVHDSVRGSAILSTETLLEFVAEKLRRAYEIVSIIYAGNINGVLDRRGNVIQELSASARDVIKNDIKGAAGFDVTGGMRHKVESAFKAAHIVRSVYIISGRVPENTSRALKGECIGTRITR